MPPVNDRADLTEQWRTLEAVFGTERLEELVGAPAGAVRQYRTGSHPTPEPMAARLGYLATLVGDLAGTYDDSGVRRWVERPRKSLDGRAPESWLHGEWSPEDTGPLRVRELARSLAGSPAT